MLAHEPARGHELPWIHQLLEPKKEQDEDKEIRKTQLLVIPANLPCNEKLVPKGEWMYNKRF